MNDVRYWADSFRASAFGTLFAEVVDWMHENPRYPQRQYDRKVLHISQWPCKDPCTDVVSHKFMHNEVFCTDGQTIGHHLPGNCPFEVKS